MSARRWPPNPPFRVDPASAHRVADALAAARSDPADPVVRAAYAQLSGQADAWYARLVDPGARHPVRVVLTATPDPYADAGELSASVRHHQVLELVPVAHDRDRRHPLLDGSIGGAHDRFRAVHDIVSHGWHGYGFCRDGELSAWLLEGAVYTGLARWALATELHGHHSVRWTSGELAPYKATLLDRRLLDASMSRAQRSHPAPGSAARRLVPSGARGTPQG